MGKNNEFLDGRSLGGRDCCVHGVSLDYEKEVAEIFPCMLDLGFFGGLKKKEMPLKVGFFVMQDFGSCFRCYF